MSPRIAKAASDVVELIVTELERFETAASIERANEIFAVQ
jgi:hypothetical protein